MILLQADVSDLKTILRNAPARNTTGRPVAAVWRSCGTHGSTGPRPASGPSRYLIACTFCTSPAPPSGLGHKPETTATVIKKKLGQVTIIYLAFYTKEIVSKQLHRKIT